MELTEPTHSYMHNGVEYHVKFVVEPSTGQLEAFDSDEISHESGLWQTGVPEVLISGDSGIPDDQDCEEVQPPLPESVRPGKEPKIKDSELSEKDLARRNRRRQINRECARHARERRNHERDQLKNRIKELTAENDNLNNKFEALLRKNKQLSLKLEEKSTTEKKAPQKLSKEQTTQTYQPGEYSNSNVSRNIINGSYKRRAVLLQAVEPQIANKKAKMQFIYPIQSNSTHDNNPNVPKKKFLIVKSNQVNDEIKNSHQPNQPIANIIPTTNQFASSDSMMIPENNEMSRNEESEKSITSKNEIATLIATMIQPLQHQIQMLTNKVAVLENKGDIKIEL